MTQGSAATEAAAGLVDDLVGAEQAAEVPQEAAQAAEQTKETVDTVEFDLAPELPDDLQMEMAGPDPEAYEVEPVYQDDTEDDDEYEDPAVTAERNKRKALEKKVAWMEEQQLLQARARWVEKDAQYFPLVNAEEIAAKASSRREFARLAKAENDRLKPLVEKFVAAEREKVAQTGQAQQAELAEAWGKPTAGPGYVPAEALETAAQIEKIRKAGSFLDATRARLGLGRSNPNDPHGVKI